MYAASQKDVFELHFNWKQQLKHMLIQLQVQHFGCSDWSLKGTDLG